MTVLLDRVDVPMFTEDLVDRLADRRRQIAALEAECADLVAELVERADHEALGHRSLVGLLVDRVGVSSGAARGMIRVATALTDMPATRLALAEGDIDLPRARLLASARDTNPVLFARHERTLVDAATSLGMTDTTRAVSYWTQQADLGAAEAGAAAAWDRRRLFVSTVGSVVHLDGVLDPVSGQVVMTALGLATDRGNLDPCDTRSAPQRRADALVEMCRDRLERVEPDDPRTERPHVMVHLSLDALEGRAGRPCELDDAGVITPQEARMLSCDARVTRVITGPDSRIVDVGRTTRVVSTGMRLALAARDRGCVMPGCGAPRRWCDAHHVVHWADGGPTTLDNLVLLCARHHTLVHQGRAWIPRRE